MLDYKNSDLYIAGDSSGDVLHSPTYWVKLGAKLEPCECACHTSPFSRINLTQCITLPHEIIDRSVTIDSQGEVNRYERFFEVPMHDEVRVRQPDIIIMMDRVQVIVFAVFGVCQSSVKPLLLQQEFHFIFLQRNVTFFYAKR